MKETKRTGLTVKESTAIARPINFVEPYQDRQAIQLAPKNEVLHTLDLPLSATQHIELRTSAVDRAKGFLIASVPLYMAFALGVLLLSVLFAGVPFWSFWGLSVFWLSFVLAWLWGYRETLIRSAEGIAHYEAKRKWDVVEREQEKRWEHYDRMLGE
jgi:hypothetical protein